ncbi:hypothetical protein [Burkholderia orbicola]|uniref:hypothetical protein n=1 Tax=Burkholderia orbicola TaxID=2978683 RepID=UPI001906E092|nr:hypothetical protein [Burkholderia orbicola]MBK1820740.1 hypothetical protein [Burkholderia orbicola]
MVVWLLSVKVGRRVKPDAVRRSRVPIATARRARHTLRRRACRTGAIAQRAPAWRTVAVGAGGRER